MSEEQGTPEVLKPTQKLARKLQENRTSLHIARIPDKTKEAFIKMAEEDFCGDYGMLLKWLVDDIISQDTKVILAKIDEHESRIVSLETSTKEEPEEDTKKMLDGSKKGGPKK